MSDYSEAEMAAVKSSFPSMTSLISDFYREQLWERWVKDRKHCLTVQEAEELLNYLHECAWAPSTTPQENLSRPHHFDQAVKILQESSL